MSQTSFRKFFSEPKYADEVPSDRGESTLDWLGRCTNWKAKECRRFLNESLNELPSESVTSFFQNAGHRWRSCFFELVVARTLQKLGATISVELPNQEGRRPDFKAEFSDDSIIVEAISPVFNATVGEETKRQKPLLEIVEAMVPAGWKCGVWELPNIGLQDSKREFKAALGSAFSDLPDGDGPFDICAEVSNGEIRLLLVRGERKSKLSIIEPIQAVFNNSEERIKYALTTKKRQVRASKEPVLLAIDAPDLFCDFEDFDYALFGRTFEQVDHHGRTLETGFDPDGIFAIPRKEEPTYAGVLAFIGVGFLKCPNPVLYKHPRFSGTLPNSLNVLETRSYNAGKNEVETTDQTEDVMEHLKFVERPKR